MTTHSDLSPVTRETSSYVRDKGLRAVIVTIQGPNLVLRPKGCRNREVIDVASVYRIALQNRVFSERSARKASRKSKK